MHRFLLVAAAAPLSALLTLLTSQAHANLAQFPYAGASGGGAVTVAQSNAAFQATGTCNPTCTPFSITTSSGNLVYIAVQEFGPADGIGYTVNCNAAPATLETQSLHSGGAAVSLGLFSCPAAAGALSITASKVTGVGTVFAFAEVHSTAGTPTTDGTAVSGYNAGSSPASVTYGGATTSTTDMLLAFAAQNAASGCTITGGGAGSWTALPSATNQGATQTETTTLTPSVTGTCAGGGSNDTGVQLVAVHP